MHIPDGFLDTRTAIAAAAVATAGLAITLPRLERQLPRHKVPLLGLGAAFVFAAQMLNFPIGGGTSGHLVGGVLITALLGPAAAVVVLTAVLLTQCLLFADGGITALGANVFDMAIVAPVVASPLLRLSRRCIQGPRGLVVGAAFAGWCSVVLASIACAGQLALSGTAPWPVAFPAMVSVHMLIGIGEGLITALVLMALHAARPDLLAADAADGGKASPWLGVTAAIGALLFVAPFASPWPDGLEQVAHALGFAPAAGSVAPLPDYQLPAVTSPVASTVIAGAIGTAVALALSWLLARALVPVRGGREPDAQA